MTRRLAFADWPQVFGSAKMNTAMPDCLTHHRDIIETGNTSRCFKNRTLADVGALEPSAAAARAAERAVSAADPSYALRG